MDLGELKQLSTRKKRLFGSKWREGVLLPWECHHRKWWGSNSSWNIAHRKGRGWVVVASYTVDMETLPSSAKHTSFICGGRQLLKGCGQPQRYSSGRFHKDHVRMSHKVEQTAPLGIQAPGFVHEAEEWLDPVWESQL